MKIAVISCCKTKIKADKKVKARDLYNSDLFNKSLAFCLEKYDQVFILSAKYGLLSLADKIKTYDLTLNKFSIKEKKEWSKKVVDNFKKCFKEDDVIYFHCGVNYRKYIIEDISNKTHTPLKGLGLG